METFAVAEFLFLIDMQLFLGVASGSQEHSSTEGGGFLSSFTGLPEEVKQHLCLQQAGGLPSFFVHLLTPSFLIPSVVSVSFVSGTVLPDVHNSHFPRGDKEEHPFFSVVRLSEGWKDWPRSQGGTLSHLCRLGSGTDS